MRLDVHMQPHQFRNGFADRVSELLATGRFRPLAGRWRTRRRLALLATERRGIVLRQVTFDLVPLDTVALRIAQRDAARRSDGD